jgi:hypothetical protein
MDSEDENIILESDINVEKLQRKSWKWDNFERLSDKRIKCKFCSKDFSDKTGIDSLRYHQKSHQSVSDNLKITQFFKK